VTPVNIIDEFRKWRDLYLSGTLADELLESTMATIIKQFEARAAILAKGEARRSNRIEAPVSDPRFRPESVASPETVSAPGKDEVDELAVWVHLVKVRNEIAHLDQDWGEKRDNKRGRREWYHHYWFPDRRLSLTWSIASLGALIISIPLWVLFHDDGVFLLLPAFLTMFGFATIPCWFLFWQACVYQRAYRSYRQLRNWYLLQYLAGPDHPVETAPPCPASRSPENITDPTRYRQSPPI
jgi:hypothetical protein